MEPLRAWLGKDGTSEKCREIIKEHLDSPAMLTILPLQDWLSMDEDLRYKGNPEDERINIPAQPRYHWDYRMHIKVEDLLKAKKFNEEVSALIKDSGRTLLPL
jgi:4-alpha-glucanotransferase